MVTRRSLLTGGAALALGLAGCSQRNAQTLAVQVLKDSVPAQVLGRFEQELKRSPAAALKYLPTNQLDQLFSQLQRWRTETPAADLMTLGDFWLTPAIQQGLIRPISTTELPGWETLPDRWREWVTRSRQGQPQSNAEVWGIPYRWGNLAIVYRHQEIDPLGWTPADWSDLWRPALKGQISLPDNARTVIGLVLKSMGKSINHPDPAAVPGVADKLAQLHQQVKTYSSSAYLQPLLLGDTWLAVGWSTDIWPVLKRDQRLRMVVPTSGTMLTADLWVRPAKDRDDAASDALIQRWLGFGLQPDTALQLSLLGNAIAPQYLGADTATIPDALQPRLPAPAVLERSEFIDVLPISATEAYRDLWIKTRQLAPR